MDFGLKERFWRMIARWLTYEPEVEPNGVPKYDFDRLCYEIRPGDVILVEGRSRVSEVIKLISQCPWTHSALYIGRLYDIEDPELRELVTSHYDGDPNEQLIIEALLGEGTIVCPINKYRSDHLRICRPTSLSPMDAQKVIAYCVKQLGTDYDIRQLLDLARYMFPYAILPRRWRSSLFSHHAGAQTRVVCSTMLVEAFHSVNFPVLPFVEKTPEGKIHFYRRNPRLFTPMDFDYSPYFDIIKYPFLGQDDITIYKQMPWHEEEIYCNDVNDCYIDPNVQKEDNAPKVVELPTEDDNPLKHIKSGHVTSNKKGADQVDEQNVNLIDAIPKAGKESA